MIESCAPERISPLSCHDQLPNEELYIRLHLWSPHLLSYPGGMPLLMCPPRWPRGASSQGAAHTTHSHSHFTSSCLPFLEGSYA